MSKRRSRRKKLSERPEKRKLPKMRQMRPMKARIDLQHRKELESQSLKRKIQWKNTMQR